MLDAVRFIQRHAHVDRLEAAVEAHIMPTAHVREAARHPRHERAHGVPVPRQAGDEGGAARGRRPVRAVDRQRRRRRGRARSPSSVGYPADRQAARRRRRVGHARASTTMASSRPRSRAAASARAARVAVEEFIEGHEGFYDTLTHRRPGRPRVRLALLPERARGDAHALDLAAVHRHEPHRQRAGYDEVKAMGQKVIDAARHRDLARRTWSGSPGRRG